MSISNPILYFSKLTEACNWSFLKPLESHIGWSGFQHTGSISKCEKSILQDKSLLCCQKLSCHVVEKCKSALHLECFVDSLWHLLANNLTAGLYMEIRGRHTLHQRHISHQPCKHTPIICILYGCSVFLFLCIMLLYLLWITSYVPTGMAYVHVVLTWFIGGL